MSLELNAISDTLFAKTLLFGRLHKHQDLYGVVFMAPVNLVNLQLEYKLPRRYEKLIHPVNLSL